MKGNFAQKIVRATTNLTLNPRYLPRWVSHNLVNGKTPLALEIPWFSYAAIDFLDTFAKPHMRVCEYGSGGSTIFFAKRTKSVFSIESDPKWFELVKTAVAAHGLRNVSGELHVFDFKQAKDFERSSFLHAIPDEHFDIIVVDGMEEWDQVRSFCFEKAEARINPGGIIVVDDSWRYPGLRTKNKARRVETFESVGPCRPGVTSTDVYFY